MTTADHGLRDGLPIREWYASEDRPKPIRDRYAKLKALHELGVEPYAYGSTPSLRRCTSLASNRMHTPTHPRMTSRRR